MLIRLIHQAYSAVSATQFNQPVPSTEEVFLRSLLPHFAPSLEIVQENFPKWTSQTSFTKKQLLLVYSLDAPSNLIVWPD